MNNINAEVGGNVGGRVCGACLDAWGNSEGGVFCTCMDVGGKVIKESCSSSESSVFCRCWCCCTCWQGY